MRLFARFALLACLCSAFAFTASAGDLKSDLKNALLGALSSTGGDLGMTGAGPIGTPEEVAVYGEPIATGISTIAGIVSDGSRILFGKIVEGVLVVKEFAVDVGTTISSVAQGFGSFIAEGFAEGLSAESFSVSPEAATTPEMFSLCQESLLNTREGLETNAKLYGYVGEGLEYAGELLIATGTPEGTAVGEPLKLIGLPLSTVCNEILMLPDPNVIGPRRIGSTKNAEEEEEEGNPATNKKQYKKLKTTPGKKEQAKSTPTVSKGKAKSSPKPKTVKSTPTVSKTKSTPKLKKTKSAPRTKWTKTTPAASKSKSPSRVKKPTPIVTNTRSKKGRTSTPYRGGSSRGRRYQQWI